MNPTSTLRTWLIRLSAIPVIAIVLLIAYTWLVMTWHYSEGDRAGYVQKFSKKGWLCKTWEGELAMVNMPGTLTEKFAFTVRDEAVAKKLSETMGQRVVLLYTQHVGIPTTCFGETGYFIHDVQAVSDDMNPMLQSMPAVAVPVPATTDKQ